MTIDDKIRDEKLQYKSNKEAGKISTLSPGKFDKCEYLTGEGVLRSDQRRMIEQSKFSCFSLGKEFEKQKQLKIKKKTK